MLVSGRVRYQWQNQCHDVMMPEALGEMIGYYIMIYEMKIHTWNPNDPCFDWKRPCFGGLKLQNRGQTGSMYIYIDI